MPSLAQKKTNATAEISVPKMLYPLVCRARVQKQHSLMRTASPNMCLNTHFADDVAYLISELFFNASKLGEPAAYVWIACQSKVTKFESDTDC